MEIKRLAATLRVLKAAGVTSYQEGDLKVSFAAPEPVLVAAPADDNVGDLELPEKVFDPRKAIADMYRKHQGGKSA